jgi:hypothetical protein
LTPFSIASRASRLNLTILDAILFPPVFHLI